MQKTKLAILIVAILTLLTGFGIIVATGRPNSPAPISQTLGNTDTPAEPTEEPDGPVLYTMADVQVHAVKEDCWTTIKGSVYDLTTWVERHPGGQSAILQLCGTDGTETFTAKHGNAPQQQAVLVLLKIGELQK